MRARMRLGAAFSAASIALVLFAIGPVSTANAKSRCVLRASPSTFTETGTTGPEADSVAFVLRVSCSPAFGEQTVQLSSNALSDACASTLSWYSADGASGMETGTGSSFSVNLDDAGNANAAVWGGPGCAPSIDPVSATLQVAPFLTATTNLTIAKPHRQAKGLTADPASEVEDDTTGSVIAIFYASYPFASAANQDVTFSDESLFARCGGDITWVGPDEVVLATGTSSVTTTLDAKGNAFVVALAGPSCASGHTSTEVTVVNPTSAPRQSRTFTTTFTVVAPHRVVKRARRTAKQA